MQDHENLSRASGEASKMKKTLLVGRHGVGKTTLTQALRGEEIRYVKTQTMLYGDWLLDSPGEYAEVHGLSSALAIYSYEADVVALLIAADDDYSLFPPNITCMVNRDVIREKFKAVLPNHIVYDMRTTFYSRCKECGIADAARDEFVGHSLGALGNAYTDLSDEYLLREGAKFKY